MKYLKSTRANLLFAIFISLLLFLAFSMGGIYLLQEDALIKETTKKVKEIISVIETGLKRRMVGHDADLIQAFVDEIKTYQNIEDAYITNADGVVKFSSHPEQIGKKLLKDTDAYLQFAAGGNTQALYTKNSHGVPILRNVTPIYNEAACFKCHTSSQKIRGILYIDYSTADTEKIIFITLIRLFLTGVAVFIILAIVIFYITNRLVHKPLALLTDGVNEISRGNYQQQINYQASDDFKMLASAFNAMSKTIVQQITDIKNKGFELSVLYKIVKKISETIYLEELKSTVIDLLLELLNCDKCIVITTTPSKNAFEMIAKEKGRPPVKSAFEYPDDEAVSSVLQEKLIFKPFANWVSEVLAIPALSVDSYSAYIPLSIHELPLGLVIAVRNADNPFEDETLRLLNVIKEHLAIAFDNARLYTLAITDDLTKLFTIRHFQVQMDMQISRFIRYGQQFSVLMMDIDKFKLVNDTYGHAAGDLVLEEVASIIKESLRDIDVPCRYGGEEFCAILHETTETGMRLVAERIRSNIEIKTIDLGNGASTSVTISIGGASCPKNGIAVNDIVLSADKALYTAKVTGRNKVVLA